jgi:hypothetical protein
MDPIDKVASILLMHIWQTQDTWLVSLLRNSIKAELIPQNVRSYQNFEEGSVHLGNFSVDHDLYHSFDLLLMMVFSPLGILEIFIASWLCHAYSTIPNNVTRLGEQFSSLLLATSYYLFSNRVVGSSYEVERITYIH